MVAGADFIQFAIGAGVQTINPLTALPTITEPLEIDGTTQPGFAGTPIIEISGPGDSQIDGLTITGGLSTIRGLVISRFAQGIRLTGEGGNSIVGNFIGTDVTGTSARRNNSDGIAVYTPDNTIGGTTAQARNVISGNGMGVCLCGGGATGNRVQGNFIGTDVSGTNAIGNGSIFYEVPFAGVAIHSASSNTIGGDEPGAGNVVSGNIGIGVQLLGAGRNTIQGNFIGVDATGAAPLANHLDGVSIGSGSGNVVGGTTPGARNVIAANEGAGVSIFVDLREGDAADGNAVQGNYIGINATLDALVGNVGGGVQIFGFGNRATGNSIGGTTRGSGNVIAGNGGAGVQIVGPGAAGNPVLLNAIAYNGGAGVAIASSASRNAIVVNAIFSNGGLGIDLRADGVTANDPGDVDAGPNGTQNFPVLASTVTSGGRTTIQGTLESRPSTAYRLEFFASPTCDAGGHGEGARFIGITAATTGLDGTSSFTADATVAVPAGWVVTATATDPAGNTSEFSRCLAVHTS